MPQVLITAPLTKDFRTWAHQIFIDLGNQPGFVIPVPPEDESEWWVWLNQVIAINRLDGKCPFFSNRNKDMNWRKAASTFVGSFS